MQKLVLILIVVIGSLSLTTAQTISSPSEFLGYDLGTQFSRNHQVIDYFKTLKSQAPNQVKLKPYGKTNERRDLYLAFISSEANIKDLETIRENNLKNTGLLQGAPTNNDIAIVWLSYNVHGNEASSSEAAMLTAFKLLTEKQEFLKNTIVIIDPSMNPDGRDRYINWYNETASFPYDIDRQASEHNEPWPGGRPNHYLFDLNRDWVWASQVETQQRLEVYNRWMPHVHVDFHEQGINEPYYFAPAAEPFHEVITDWQRDFQTEIGKNHASYFDAEGWLFFTRERFDLFYPSYGDTYPTFMGAMGMTYEQGGHGMAGLGILNDEGHVLTLVERLTHHTTTGLSTIEMASKHAKQLNTEFKKFFNNDNLKYKSYVLKGNEDKIEKLKTLLDTHQIAYQNPTTSKVSGINYTTGTRGTLNVDNNAIVVHTNQPKGKMVKALFEPNAKLSDSLTYDITAWSLPYAYGLEAIASTTNVPSDEHLSLKPTLQILTDSYGYVSKWNSMNDAQFLAELLKNDFKVRFTEKPFTSNNTKFERGSLIITKGDNKHIPDFLEKLNVIAQEYAQALTEISSGFSQTTPDIGSPDIKLINKQKVAVLSGEGTRSLSYGEIWHFFEQQLQYPLTSINTNDFSKTNLNKYNVLILPNGNYRKVLSEDNITKLKDWVRSGGKVIAIDGALRSFAGKDGFSLNYKKSEDSSLKKDNLTAYADREREYSNNLITGAIFKTNVDATHPMAFGYDNNYFTLKLGSSAYNLLDSGYNVAYLNDTKVFSGFAGQNAVKNLNQTLVFGEETMGNGSFIYMVDNPLFRSFWENGKLFFVNSIFMVNNNAYEL